MKLMKSAVLLLQMGGPESINDVEPFLYNLFSDPYIIQLPFFMKPFQSQLAQLISSKRAPKVSVLYEEIGGGSPIRFETECQAKALEKYLAKEGIPSKVYYAMRYSKPFLKDIIPQIRNDQIQEITVIPLYPQYSQATSGSSLFECKNLFDKTKLNQSIKINYIESWFDNPFYIKLMQERIFEQLCKDEITHSSNSPLILFSAHGLPTKYVEDGDPYQKQIECSINLIMQDPKLKHLRFKISYQSKVGPVKWLEPSTEKTIIELGKTGEKSLIVVPISFVGDHIETLHEINIEYKTLARENGIEHFLMTRAPKANPLLIKALRSLLLRDFQHNK